jgi:hypothetical protein
MRLGLKHVPVAASEHRMSGRLQCDRNKRQRCVLAGKNYQIRGVVDARRSESDTRECHSVRPWLTLRQPSPQHEKPMFWHSKSNTSTTSSNHRSLLAENEPFSISRESFDSYRRSFVCLATSGEDPANRSGHLRALSHPRQYPRDLPPSVARCAPLRRYQTFPRCPPFARHAALVNAATPP